MVESRARLLGVGIRLHDAEDVAFGVGMDLEVNDSVHWRVSFLKRVRRRRSIAPRFGRTAKLHVPGRFILPEPGTFENGKRGILRKTGVGPGEPAEVEDPSLPGPHAVGVAAGPAKADLGVEWNLPGHVFP